MLTGACVGCLRDRRQPAPSAQDFHNRAQEEVRQWNACVQGRGVRECVKGFSPQQLVKGEHFLRGKTGAEPQSHPGQGLLPDKPHPSCCPGMYVEFLQDWLEHFPREQLLFLRSEDYAAATNEHMAAIFRFLGMQQPSAPEMGSILSMHKRNQQSKVMCLARLPFKLLPSPLWQSLPTSVNVLRTRCFRRRGGSWRSSMLPSTHGWRQRCATNGLLGRIREKEWSCVGCPSKAASEPPQHGIASRSRM